MSTHILELEERRAWFRAGGAAAHSLVAMIAPAGSINIALYR